MQSTPAYWRMVFAPFPLSQAMMTHLGLKSAFL